MKKIVYCTYEIAIRGGEQRILINKANYLASHGYEVHFLTSDQQTGNRLSLWTSGFKCMTAR